MKSHQGRSVVLTKERINEMNAVGAWDDKILIDHFDEWVKTEPDRTAIISYFSERDEKISVSFAELSQLSKSIAANFTRLGIGLGDIVSFQLNNRWEFYAISLACVRVGAVTNPLMPVLREKELSYMLELSRSRIFIVPKRFKRFDFKAMALRLREELPTLEYVFVLDDDDSETGFGCLTGEADFIQPPPPHANEIMQLLFTSGTTGEPKGSMHTANTLFANVRQFVERIELTGDDVVLCPTPLAHQLGYLFGLLLPVFTGATVIYQDIWNADTAADLIEQDKATVCVGATPFLADLANLEKISECDLSRFRLFVSGGAPIPPALVRSAKAKLDAEIIPVWGMTEVLVVTLVKLGDPEAKIFGTDGVAVDHVAVRIVDDNGNQLPCGREGRLEASGASICVGYLKRPELYKIADEIWFDTGDLARMDEDGYIRITGRSKDIIIRGGENIPVIEIENALYRHGNLAQVAIVAMPDPRLGERACAFVVLKKGKEFSMAEMSRYLTEQRITKVYYPERLEIVDKMPMTATGKIQKFELRSRAKNFGFEKQ
ncbi:MAG: AMP-binding protein [Rhizobiaceae bacterium]